ncbi:MAG: TetR/AcrR family transcriptional regulator, partial [Roseitalea sp.]|nr:TetR/AcrR family transcriptional regulator [Roseitalea sp.]
ATDLAERIVLEQGGSALNARGLAERLGISVGTLYNAFGDLDGVVRAVNARCADRLAATLEAASKGAPPEPRARLVAIGEAYMDFALSEPRRWWMLFERDVDAAPDASSQELQEQLLRMLVTAGGGDPDTPGHRQFFLLLWASVHGLVSLAVRPAIAAIDPDAARRYIGDLVDAGLRSFPAGRRRPPPAE